MKNLHLPLVIEEDEDGVFIISCPSFNGCHSYGKTIDEALSNIREAIDLCLEETSPQEINKFVGFRELEIEYNA
ncbi:MAG: type II toxin-antitoxin system HicB family antitoxin [Ignavibacteriales bacterium]|nr:type II toxin-antitoxin system HicB family antitoxin [Ignavibacteriales bacterium]